MKFEYKELEKIELMRNISLVDQSTIFIWWYFFFLMNVGLVNAMNESNRKEKSRFM